MNQKEYFNCSTYRKKKKKYCTSHQITAHAALALIQNDIQYTIRFAKKYRDEFFNILKRCTDIRTKREMTSAIEEKEEAENRINLKSVIKIQEKIGQSLKIRKRQ